MRGVRFFLFAGLLVTTLEYVLAQNARAADEPASISAENAAEASALRKKAIAHFDKKEWAEAVEAFQKALALERKAGAMANMASALNQLGRYEEALRWYESVLVEFPNASDKLRRQVEAEMKELIAKVGTIAVEGDIVEGARLFIDDRDAGPLPLQAPVRVLGGIHEVRVVKQGFAAIVASVEVTAGQATIAKLVAKSRPAKLEIREKHNWIVRVELDGQDIGSSPISKIVEAGQHRIRLRGFMRPEALLACETPEQAVDMGARMESEEKVIEVGLFETKSVELSAEDMDTSVRIESTPSGANLWIDGQEMGNTPWEGRLPLGEHALEVRSKGFYVAKQRVTLERRRQRDIGIALERVPPPPSFWTARTVGTTAGIGVGILGLGAFAVTGGLALKNASDLEIACPRGTCPGPTKTLVDETHQLGNAALATLVVGAVGVTAGVAVWVFAAPKPQKRDMREQATLHVQLGMGGAALRGRF